MESKPTESFWAYYGRVLAQVGEDAAKNLLATVTAAAAALLGAGIDFRYHHAEWRGLWSKVVTSTSAGLVIFALYLLVHLLRAPWKLDTERRIENERLKSQVKGYEAVGMEPVVVPSNCELIPGEGVGVVLSNQGSIFAQNIRIVIPTKPVAILDGELEGQPPSQLSLLAPKETKFLNLGILGTMMYVHSDDPAFEGTSIGFDLFYEDMNGKQYKTTGTIECVSNKLLSKTERFERL
jgi:hypothetical protein